MLNKYRFRNKVKDKFGKYFQCRVKEKEKERKRGTETETEGDRTKRKGKF